MGSKSVGKTKANKKKKELACKPGSVENSHSSRPQVTLRLKQSTREPRGPRVCPPI